MTFFNLFLPTTAFLLGIMSAFVLYWVVTKCSKSEFVPIYYFIGLSIVSISVLSASRISEVLIGGTLLDSVLLKDLMIAWTSLFLFGALWESYEASICVMPKALQD